MKQAALLVAGLAALGACSAQADDGMAPGNHYLGALGTYTWKTDKDRDVNVDYSTGFHILFGTQGESHFGYELQAFGDIFETGNSGIKDFYRYGGGLDIFYAFGDRTGFTPFVKVGGNYAWNDAFPDRRDDSDWGATGAVGFVTAPFTRVGNLKLRAEAQYVYDNWETGYADYRGHFGIEIPLFETVAAEPLPPIEHTTEVVQVVEVPGPTTGLADDDGDGVINDRDQCPQTPPGDRVDGQGCTLQKVIVLKGVNFEFDSSKLRPDAESILDGSVETLKRYPDMKVEVAGHTDSKGSDAYNDKLSQRRAESVLAYFASKGVPAGQASAMGYGEKEPIASNDTDEGREENRRVELRILN